MQFLKTLSCKQATELVSRSLDTELGLLQRVRLRAHLGVCAACGNFVHQMNFLRKAIRKHAVLKDDESKE